MFFLALFTTVVPARSGLIEAAAVVATIVVLALAGYTLIALVFSRSVFQQTYRKIAHVFDALFGVAMIALGIRVSLSDS